MYQCAYTCTHLALCDIALAMVIKILIAVLDTDATRLKGLGEHAGVDREEMVRCNSCNSEGRGAS